MTARPVPLVVNGWTIFGHPLFIDQLEPLYSEVFALSQKDPDNFHKKNAAKRLAVIAHLMLDAIPQDPEKAEYRQGTTLGDDRKHWFRAKFFQQYRLFFRYHKASKIILLGWVNDEDSKRAYGSGSDAYKVFSKMLGKGQPPDDWDQLLAEATAASGRWAETLQAVGNLNK
ncbi:type II toxin-antitoxin system YhaV family toxin [Caballeronia sp. LjRoot31]|uniref:type II toxin-antitoxin system YhaV family toxin n=1 Tax=Caballeronia sp. LjRoot31 TaxID=3342324 RepID=UPI003ECD1D7F